MESAMITTVSHGQKIRCFACKYFMGCTEAGDVRCQKETDSVLNIVCISTVQMCRNKNWRRLSYDRFSSHTAEIL